VRRTHDLVVLPTLSIAFLPHAVFVAQLAVATGKHLSSTGEVSQAFQKLAHMAAPLLGLS
jgi:hypothetical protein